VIYKTQVDTKVEEKLFFKLYVFRFSHATPLLTVMVLT